MSLLDKDSSSNDPSLLEKVNERFIKLLEEFNGGISNTSTAKYNDIKALVASELSLGVDEVYATGSGGRISNLDTRLPQGNLKNQNTPLALVFLKAEAREGESSEVTLERIRKSFSATCNKFVSGEERGTTFDGILCFVQLSGELDLRPLRFVHTPDCSYRDKLIAAFPDVDVEEIARLGDASNISSTTSSEKVAQDISVAELKGMLDACESAVAASGLSLSEGLLCRYIASLLTKRFVILAGLSGSGKTKVALAVSKWLEEVEGQVEVVAVGADWTSNENVLGYRDALDPERYRRPTSGALDLVIRATKDQSRPYFLILDEMNLSHVERYFADILSAVESEEPVALHSGDGDVDGVPATIMLPPNLFIVGTVNVDETTYMFSPKVLDRANVIEFRVTAEEMEGFLATPKVVDLAELQGNGAQFGPLLVAAAAAPLRFLADLPPEIVRGEDVQAEVQRHLVRLFSVLATVGAEFGYRTAVEICRFICVHALLVGPGWRLVDALDAQVLQKLMPKLHGSERRLRPVLQQLDEYSEEAGLVATREKIARMQSRLRDGFASFLD